MFNKPINKESSSADFSKNFHVGINEPVTLVKLTREPAKEGSDNMVTAAHFRNSDGEEFRYVKFDVDVSRVKQNTIDYPKTHYKDNKVHGYVKGAIVTPQQAVDIAEQKYSTWIYSLISAYVPESDINLNPKDYDDLVTQANALLKGHFESIPVRLKIVYRYNSEFFTLPDFGFIEKVSVQPATVVITRYDNLVKKEADAAPQHPGDTANLAF